MGGAADGGPTGSMGPRARSGRDLVRALAGSAQTLQFEQPRCICMGGHLTEPYEQ